LRNIKKVNKGLGNSIWRNVKGDGATRGLTGVSNHFSRVFARTPEQGEEGITERETSMAMMEGKRPAIFAPKIEKDTLKGVDRHHGPELTYMYLSRREIRKGVVGGKGGENASVSYRPPKPSGRNWQIERTDSGRQTIPPLYSLCDRGRRKGAIITLFKIQECRGAIAKGMVIKNMIFDAG